jgi:hypothetical protein
MNGSPARSWPPWAGAEPAAWNAEARPDLRNRRDAVHLGRDHQTTVIGIDISTVFAAACARIIELGVDGQVSFMHGDASDYVATEPSGIASCIAATWIGGGVPGTGRTPPAKPATRRHDCRRAILAAGASRRSRR